MVDRIPIVLDNSGNIEEIDTSTDNLGVKLEHLSDVLSSPSPAAHSRLVHDGTNWKTTPGGGICCYRDSQLALSGDNTWYNIGWNLEQVKWGNLTHSTSTNTDEILLSVPGIIKIAASVTFEFVDAAIGNCHMKLQEWTGAIWADILGSERVQFLRANAGINGTVSVTMIHDFGSSTKFRIAVKRVNCNVIIPAYMSSVAAEYINAYTS